MPIPASKVLTQTGGCNHQAFKIQQMFAEEMLNQPQLD